MIVLITSGFPYGGEPFLNLEKDYMPNNVIYFSEKPMKEKNDDVKNDSFIIPLDKKHLILLSAFTGLFSKEFKEEVVSLKKSKKFNFKNILKMVKELGYSRYAANFISKNLPKSEDGYIFYAYWMASHAIIASLLKKKFENSKAISRCHGYDIYEFRNTNNYLSFRKLIFDTLDYVLPISNSGVNYLKDNYKFLDASKLKLFRLGTKKIINQDEAYKDNLSENEVEKNECFTIVSCSNVEPNKRVERIAQIVNSLNFRCKWYHFGKGTHFDDLVKYCDNNINSQYLEYNLLGQVENKEILKFYKENKIDLFINVSESEGIPVTMMEAMSMGIPCIGTNVGGVSEIITENYSGYLINKDFDNLDVIKIINNYRYSDEDLKKSFCFNAYETWNKKFNADKNFRDFYEFIEKI